MRTQLMVRNAVCVTTDVTPEVFDVAAFAEALGLGASQEVLRLPGVSVTEWEKARLQVLPDKIQLGFKSEADDGGFVRDVLAAFLSRVDQLAPDKKFGFNAVLLLTPEEGDGDPSAGAVDAAALTEALGGAEGRGGVTLVFRDDLGSRWWLELSPEPDGDAWSFDFNREFRSVPTGADRDKVLDWFVDIERATLVQFETISGGGGSE